jgi:hypothetical protein
MKSFQKFLLAPVALGLASPLAASAADLNLGAVNRYATGSSEAQVTSVSQFSDVRPTDWAYQALANLVENYGCVAGYPNGTFKGVQPLTRYEAAALLNSCLDRVTEVTDEIKKLMGEFDSELTVLRGRVDKLEAKVGQLEATQFSTTTKLRADTRWVLGGLSYSGNQVNGNNTYGRGATQQTLRDALTFNYDVRLNFDTSFTGKDLLKTQLRAGNFAESGFSSTNNVTRLAQLDAAYEEGCGTGDCGDVASINRLYYRFPVGKTFTAVIGPRFRQDDGLAVRPSVYNADKILKLWDFNGAPGAYSQVLGGGAALWWKQPGKTGFSFGGVYVAGNADSGQPTAGAGCNAYAASTLGTATNTNCGGIGNALSQQTGSLQLAYTGKNWNLTGMYTYNSAGVGIAGTPLSQALLPTVYGGPGSGSVSSWGLSGYWQPIQSGAFPSISAGWGYNDYNYGGAVASATTFNVSDAASQSWFVGLNWRDVFAKGNAFGFAFGQPTFVTSLTNRRGVDVSTQDGNYALEAYYKFQVTDKISVTPAVFWLSRARGELTNAAATLGTAVTNPGLSGNSTLSTFGGLIQTTFRF